MVAKVSHLENDSARIEAMQRIHTAQQQAHRREPMPAAATRIDNLRKLRKAVLEYRDELVEAINRDFGNRSRDESLLAEIMPSVGGIDHTIKHVRRWMKPSRRKVGMQFAPAKARVEYQPVGVVGVIVPWNYPLYLAIGPLTAALAAGNRVMIKMSEFTPNTAEVVEKLVSATFNEDHVAVITGEVEVAAAFSSLPFDHLLFTGSTSVGRHVMRAASENLTPVTLELGGKSPAIISDSVPMKDAVERMSFGKMVNAGQTCVAPDYVLCPRQRVDEFVDTLRATLARMYPRLADNPDYTSIINQRQFDRLRQVMDDAREKGAELIELNPASEDLAAAGKIAPHVVMNATDEMQVMRDEIFGPLLPVIPYDSLDQAIAFVNDRPRPLALYYFDYDRQRVRHVLDHTHSGGVCINDTLSHVAQDDLPFGGTGPSGMGHYHAHEGFLTFSHARGVFERPRFNSMRMAYPPYGRFIHRMIYKLFLR